MVKKTDLRVIKTKKAIKIAFLTLVKEKGYEKITIQDIASKALMNRNTFYLHYLDKNDLANKLVDESLAKIEASISKSEPLSPNNIDRAYFSKLLHALFKGIASDKELFQAMLADNIQSNFSKKLKEVLINHIVFNNQNIKIKTAKKERVRLEYMVTGIIGVINFWINHAEFSIEEVTNFLCEIHFSNAVVLLKP